MPWCRVADEAVAVGEARGRHPEIRCAETVCATGASRLRDTVCDLSWRTVTPCCFRSVVALEAVCVIARN